MTQVQMTAADVTDADMVVFSDMYKECYGVRPRFKATKEDYADLANRYDAIQAELEAEEQRHLEVLRDKHGVNFANMSAYYDWCEAESWKRYEAEQEARRLLKLEQTALRTRKGNVIERWEHGEL